MSRLVLRFKTVSRNGRTWGAQPASAQIPPTIGKISGRSRKRSVTAAQMASQMASHSAGRLLK